MVDKLNREISIIYDLLFGYTGKMNSLREKLDDKDFSLPVQMAMLIKINNYNKLTEDKSEFFREELKRNFNVLLNRYAAKKAKDILSAPIEEEIFVLFFSLEGKDGDETEIKAYEIEFARYIKKMIEEKSLFRLTIGLGRRYKDVKGLILSYKEALNANKFSYFMGKDDIIHVDNIIQFKRDIPIFISEMEENFMEKIRNKKLEELDSDFMKIIDSIIEEGVDPETIKIKIMEICNRMVRELDQEEFLYKYSNYQTELLELETRVDLVDKLEEFISEIIKIIKRKQKVDENKREINIALDYLEKNYKKEIALSDIAKRVGLSTYYFSHIFKKQLGEGFVTYLNRLRIEKSKILLKKSDLSIAEISYQVGYNDPNYFTRVFKDYEEITPSDYKFMNINREM